MFKTKVKNIYPQWPYILCSIDKACAQAQNLLCLYHVKI